VGLRASGSQARRNSVARWFCRMPVAGLEGGQLSSDRGGRCSCGAGSAASASGTWSSEGTGAVLGGASPVAPGDGRAGSGTVSEGSVDILGS